MFVDNYINKIKQTEIVRVYMKRVSETERDMNINFDF